MGKSMEWEKWDFQNPKSTKTSKKIRPTTILPKVKEKSNVNVRKLMRYDREIKELEDERAAQIAEREHASPKRAQEVKGKLNESWSELVGQRSIRRDLLEVMRGYQFLYLKDETDLAGRVEFLEKNPGKRTVLFPDDEGEELSQGLPKGLPDLTWDKYSKSTSRRQVK